MICLLKQSLGECNKHHGDSFSSKILTETWNHRVAEVGRVWFIWPNPHCIPPLLHQCQLQHLVQVTLAYLQCSLLIYKIISPQKEFGIIKYDFPSVNLC